MHAFCLLLLKFYKTIKKGWKITLIILAVLFLFTSGVYLALQSKGIQTFIAQKIANVLTREINAKLHIGHVDIGFFNKVTLKDVVLEGQSDDTLLIAPEITVKIDSFGLRRKFIAIGRLTFDKPRFFIEKDSMNRPAYQFIIDSLKSQGGRTGQWQASFRNFKVKNAQLSYNMGDYGKKNILSVSNIGLSINNLLIQKDSVYFELEHLAFMDNKGFLLREFKAKVVSKPGKFDIRSIYLETNHSKIEEAGIRLEKSEGNGQEKPEYNLDFKFDNSNISFRDLAKFIPSLKGMEQLFKCSGRIYGNLDDLKGKDVRIQTGNNTLINFDFYANGLNDIKSMYLFLDLRHSQTDFKDISNIKLPDNSHIRNLSFPESFYDAGLITYEGNFSGFLTDFVTYGTLQSNMGEITTDLSIVPGKSGNVQLKGKLATSNFDVGHLYNNKHWGKVSFHGQVFGIYNKTGRFVDGTFDGIVSAIDLNNYTYRDIILDGGLFDKKFSGQITIDDPNLRFDFNGELNLNPETPKFNFNLLLYKANLIALNLDPYNTTSELSFLMNADFEGNSIDNMKGSIKIEHGNYRNQNNDMILSGITLASSSYNSNDSLLFSSDFADASIYGSFNISTLTNAVKSIVGRYIPSILPKAFINEGGNNFDFRLVVKDLSALTKSFVPGLSVLSPFEISGNLNSKDSRFSLNGHIPGVNYKNMAFRDILLYANSREQFSTKFKCGEFRTKKGFTLYNFAVNSDASGNKLNTRITWNNFQRLSYSGGINTTAEFSGAGQRAYPSVKIDVAPSKIYIADSLWRIEPCRVYIDSTSIAVRKFMLHKKGQSITADGSISEDKLSNFELSFQNIGLKQFEAYLQTKTGLNGHLNGTIGITDVYGETFINSDLEIDGLKFRGQDIGNVSIINKWDKETKFINTELVIERDKKRQLLATGHYDPKEDSLDFNASFDHLPLILLEKVMSENFSNFHGNAIGNVRIHGKLENILIDGALYGSDAGLTLKYLQVGYNFNDTVKFAGNAIIFDKIKVFDMYGNQGVFDGSIVHQNFHKMDYNLLFSSPKILAMNTRPRHNERFYGKIFASGDLFITGHGVNVNLDGEATTLSGTSVNISLDYDEDVQTYNFIRFVNNGAFKEKEAVFENKTEPAMNLNLTIHATPEAKAQIIYNSKVGDIIKAEGEGVLRFGMDKDGNITLSGDYNVSRGEYLFTLQNVINKRFTIEKGGSITWSGDPYNANIDIKAIYGLKASLHQLFVDNYSKTIDNTKRIQVNCKIILTGNLDNPSIDFKIDFPTADDRVIDELQQFFNTKEELNKQILSLLVLGQFYTPEYMRGTYEATSTNVLGTTASELFSNQLSNWLSQISNNVDIGFNYRPGNQLTNNEIELALSTQMFNDRVTINGNIGNNVNHTEYANNQIVGDFDINVKLSNNGKLQLKAYNHSNNNLIYETAPYTQGIGFSYKEEFNTLKDLIGKFRSLFLGKKARNR